MRPLCHLLLRTLVLGSLLAPAISSGQESEDAPSESLFNKLKRSASDLKDSAPLDKIGSSLGDVKDSLIKNVDAINGLKKEVAGLELRISQLEDAQAALEDLVANNTEANAPDKAEKKAGEIESITAGQLASIYAESTSQADKTYLNRYLEVTGNIQSFRGGKDVTILLNPHKPGLPPIACHFLRNAGFDVELYEHEGRLAHRADRTTYLQIGMPIKVQGTCKGYSHDVRIQNCRIIGDQPKPPAKKDDKKK